MYTLTLTANERQAFDWVGGRYAAGRIAAILGECMPANSEWSDSGDITFTIPEHRTWAIGSLAMSENFTWACFAADLREKMNDFCNQII
jgi:hypothetical protein